MALERATGVLAIPNTTGNQSVTTLSFQPKLLFVWMGQMTADGTQNGPGVFSWGAAADDGGTLTQGYVGGHDNDNAATSQCASSLNTDALLRLVRNNAGTFSVDMELDIVSFNANGFTINVADAPATANIRMHYLALGGSDVDKARVFTFQYTPGTPPALTAFDVAVPFTSSAQPDLLMMGLRDDNTHPTAVGQGNGDFNIGLGVGYGGAAGDQALSTWGSDNGAGTSGVYLYQKVDAILAGTNNAPPISYEAKLDVKANWPANGFRMVPVTNNTGGPTNLPVLCVAVKGNFQKKVGSSSTSTTLNGTVDFNAGFVPRAGLLFGGNQLASASAITVDSAGTQLGTWGIGAYDGTNENHASVASDDGNATAQNTGNTDSTAKVWRSFDPSATAATAPVLAGEADATVSGNNIRLTWTDADAAVRQHMVLALGSATAQSVSLTPVTETDTAVALSVTKTIRKTLTPVTEADAAVALVAVKPIVKSLTPVTETSSAVALSYAVQSDITVSLTPVVETGLAVALDIDKRVTLTPATEADTALARTVTKTIFKSLTPIAEADSAVGLVVTKPIHKSLTPVTETSSAVGLAVTKPIRVTLSPVSEQGSAVALQVTKPIRVTLIPAVEDDDALPLSVETSGPQYVTLQAVSETDEALALGVTKTIFKSLTPATESGAAVPLSVVKPILKSLVPVVGLEQAQPLVVTKPLRVTIAPVNETDQALTLTYTTIGPRYYSIEPVIEGDVALALVYDIPASLKPVMHRGIMRDRTIDGPVIIVTADQAVGPVQMMNGIPQDARGYMIVVHAEGPGETLASGWPIVRVT